jgi:hypothetical protein
VLAGAVPVARDGLGVKRYMNAKILHRKLVVRIMFFSSERALAHLADAVHDVACQPTLVGCINALYGAYLQLAPINATYE